MPPNHGYELKKKTKTVFVTIRTKSNSVNVFAKENPYIKKPTCNPQLFMAEIL